MIEHVFVLMLENRSFDHMLGLAGWDGRDAVSGAPTRLAGLTGSESNRLISGESVPVTAGADFVLTVDPGHEFGDVLEQLCGAGATFSAGGAYPPIDNSGFASRLERQLKAMGVSGSPASAMRCFEPEQLPVLHTLAQQFAVCDHWFSSLPGPTWPNRFFAHAASSAGLDGSPSMTQSAAVLLEGWKFANGAIYNRLDQAGLRWSVVEGDAFPQALAIEGMVARALEGRFVSLADFLNRLNEPAFADAYVFIEPSYGHVLADGRNFKCGTSQHPLDDVTRGEGLIKQVYEAIRNSPHWDTSLLIVTYDEHGGFFDHVAPPAAIPPGDIVDPSVNRFGFRFDQLGVRVPAVVVSPYIAAGTVDHTAYDHSSILATVESLFGLRPLTQRDAGAASLRGLVSLPAPRSDAPLKLPAPAVSGMAECRDQDGELLAADLAAIPGHLAGQLEPALAGFLHVALTRDLQLAARSIGDVQSALSREKDRLLSTYDAIQTKFDAVRYLRDVETRYQASR